MTLTKNSAVIFKAVPAELPMPGEHLILQQERTIDLEAAQLNGGVLVKTNVLGIDPYLRNRMAGDYTLGEPILGHGVGVVLRSEDAAYKPGDHLYTGDFPFEEYAVLKPSPELVKIKEVGIPWTAYMSVLGMPGITGWVGWKHVVKARKGETIYVSSAAGVVGSIVCQLAKAEGLKVVASAGSEEKIKFLIDELKVDVAFNYKTQDLESVLKEHGPVDIYWDSVGGKQLETVLGCMARFGRVVICGFISGYNGGEPYSTKNISPLILYNDLTVQGFSNFHVVEKYGDFNFYEEVPQLVRDGNLKVLEQISHKLEDVPHLLLDTQLGRNFGKPIIVLSED